MFIGQLIYLFRVWQRYRTCVRELSHLSDMELADIGVARSGIHWVPWRTSVDDAAGRPPIHPARIDES